MNAALDLRVPKTLELVSLPLLIVWVAQWVRTPARKAGDPGSNPGPGENFSLKF